MSDNPVDVRNWRGLAAGRPARIYPGQGYENGELSGNRALIVAPMDQGAILIGNVVLQKKLLLDMIEWLDSPECR